MIGSLAANGSVTFDAPRTSSMLTVYAKGTWGSGTITVYVTPDGTNFFPTDLTFTADGFGSVAVVAKQVRATLAGASSPSLTVWLRAQGTS